eukprot:TRINITY_DN9707_c0_g1_i1.p1 TRINITY_DN9707_c0_g1~~TRINITY_DN9707_c0_g1_i1.p1  ORF type:complete len:1355 (-),score=353.12 TRINITY_DN9707_c0_g1_i1:512-4576(-)
MPCEAAAQLLCASTAMTADLESLRREHEAALLDLRETEHVLAVEATAEEEQRGEIAASMEAADSRLRSAKRQLEERRLAFRESQQHFIEERFGVLALSLLKDRTRRELLQAARLELEAKLAEAKRRRDEAAAARHARKAVQSRPPAGDGQLAVEAEVRRLQEQLKVKRALKRKAQLQQEVQALMGKLGTSSSSSTVPAPAPALTAAPPARPPRSSLTPGEGSSLPSSSAAGQQQQQQQAPLPPPGKQAPPMPPTGGKGKAPPPPKSKVGAPPPPVKGGGSRPGSVSGKGGAAAGAAQSNGLVNVTWNSAAGVKETDLRNCGFLNPVATLVEGDENSASAPAQAGRHTAFSASQTEIEEMHTEQLAHWFRAKGSIGGKNGLGSQALGAAGGALGTAGGASGSSTGPGGSQPKRKAVLEDLHIRALGIFWFHFKTKQPPQRVGQAQGDLVGRIREAVLAGDLPTDCLEPFSWVCSVACQSVLDFVKENGLDVLNECVHGFEHKLVYAVGTIPRVKERFDCMAFATHWAAENGKIMSSLRKLEHALAALIDVKSIIGTFMQTVQSIGNALNRDSNAPFAEYGWKISTLPKVLQLKSQSTPQQSMLVFIVALMSEGDLEALLRCIPLLQEAKVAKSGACAHQCKDFLKGRASLENKLRNVPIERYPDGSVNPKDKFHAKMNEFCKSTRRAAHDMTQKCHNVLQKYWELAVYLGDPAAVYPPPQKDDDVVQDMFTMFLELFSKMNEARSTVKNMKLREEIDTARRGSGATSHEATAMVPSPCRSRGGSRGGAGASEGPSPAAAQRDTSSDELVTTAVERLRSKPCLERKVSEDRHSDVSSWADSPRQASSSSSRGKSPSTPKAKPRADVGPERVADVVGASLSSQERQKRRRQPLRPPSPPSSVDSPPSPASSSSTSPFVSPRGGESPQCQLESSGGGAEPGCGGLFAAAAAAASKTTQVAPDFDKNGITGPFLSGPGTSNVQPVVRGRLHVAIVGASGLRQEMLGASPWCSCVIKHADNREKPSRCDTKALPRTTEPRWDETHELEEWQSGDALEFSVFFKSLFWGPKLQGTVLIPSEKFYPGPLDATLPLDGQDNARLHVRVSVVPDQQALQPQPRATSDVIAGVPTDASSAGPPLLTSMPPARAPASRSSLASRIAAHCSPLDAEAVLGESSTQSPMLTPCSTAPMSPLFTPLGQPPHRAPQAGTQKELEMIRQHSAAPEQQEMIQRQYRKSLASNADRRQSEIFSKLDLTVDEDTFLDACDQVSDLQTPGGWRDRRLSARDGLLGMANEAALAARRRSHRVSGATPLASPTPECEEEREAARQNLTWPAAPIRRPLLTHHLPDLPPVEEASPQKD